MCVDIHFELRLRLYGHPMILHYPEKMANRDQPTSPRQQTDRMRDPDYVVRGYKAALYNRSTSPGKYYPPA